MYRLNFKEFFEELSNFKKLTEELIKETAKKHFGDKLYIGIVSLFDDKNGGYIVFYNTVEGKVNNIYNFHFWTEEDDTFDYINLGEIRGQDD